MSSIHAPTRHLLLMRHAKSDWGDPALGDHDRPLNARGMRTAPRMGQHIESMQIPIHHILCSTACRAQQTLRLMQNVWQKLRPEVTYAPNLYLASPSGIVSELSRLNAPLSGAMIIGHNPGISELACGLAQENIELSTAALVVLAGSGGTWAGALERSPWRLEGLYFPKKLGFS